MTISDLLGGATPWIIFGVCLTAFVVVVSIAAPLFFIRFVRGSYGPGGVKNGVTATATITRMWDTGTTINDNPLAGFELQVMPPNGAPFTAETKQMVNRLQVGYFQPGQTVTVSYNPANPNKIHITGVGAAAGAPAPAYQGATGTPGMQPQMNPAVIEQQLRQIDADNEVLRATGQPAPAQVISYMDWNVHVNGENPAVTLQLQVTPPGKPAFMAQASGIISVSSVPKFQPGCTIWVKYDPTNLTRVTIDHS
ncbi:MAG: hypothetical protein EHM70_22595 [Chloroflexota bacterium]|nr:MAG: hypothetical protein EHM70_22595 [Chloroflexota bacterium]